MQSVTEVNEMDSVGYSDLILIPMCSTHELDTSTYATIWWNGAKWKV